MTIQAGIPVARIELLDIAQVKAVNNYSNLSLPESPLLLLEFHGSKSSVKSSLNYSMKFLKILEEIILSGILILKKEINYGKQGMMFITP